MKNSADPVRLVLAQITLQVGNVNANVQQILAAAETAQDRWQANAIAFPELSLSGYPPEDLLLRPDFLAEVEQGLQQLCAAGLTIDLILGYPCRQENGLYNCAAVLRQGQLIG